MRDLEYAKGFWNPYVAGIALGLVLLLTFYLMGTGLGASGAVARTAAVIAHEAAPTAVEQNPYYKEFYKPGGEHPSRQLDGHRGGRGLSRCSDCRVDRGQVSDWELAEDPPLVLALDWAWPSVEG